MSVPASQMQDAGHKAAHGALTAAAGAVSRMAQAQGGAQEPHPAVMALLQALHGKMDQLGQGGQGVGTPAPGDPNAADAGQGSADQQAVWDTFPSTDPSVLSHLAQTSSDPSGMLMPLLHMMAGDEQHLHDLQMQQVSALLEHLSTPAGGPVPDQAAQSPGVTGGMGAGAGGGY